MSKMKAKLVAWHPDIATQMCLSSEDDNSPYLQIWDLRFASSPVRILEGHQRGICKQFLIYLHFKKILFHKIKYKI